MTDIRKGVENDRRCFRERASTMGGTPETPCHDAVLELYERLDELEKAISNLAMRDPRQFSWWQEALTDACDLANDNTPDAVVALIGLLRGDAKPEPEHEPCMCGSKALLLYAGSHRCWRPDENYVCCDAECGWRGRSGKTEAEAWDNWDRFMRAAREGR